MQQLWPSGRRGGPVRALEQRKKVDARARNCHLLLGSQGRTVESDEASEGWSQRLADQVLPACACAYKRNNRAETTPARGRHPRRHRGLKRKETAGPRARPVSVEDAVWSTSGPPPHPPRHEPLCGRGHPPALHAGGGSARGESRWTNHRALASSHCAPEANDLPSYLVYVAVTDESASRAAPQRGCPATDLVMIACWPITTRVPSSLGTCES